MLPLACDKKSDYEIMYKLMVNPSLPLVSIHPWVFVSALCALNQHVFCFNIRPTTKESEGKERSSQVLVSMVSASCVMQVPWICLDLH